MLTIYELHLFTSSKMFHIRLPIMGDALVSTP